MHNRGEVWRRLDNAFFVYRRSWLQSTPAIETVEGAWGYRALEKTIVDLRGIAFPRDLGIALRGKIDGDGVFNPAVGSPVPPGPWHRRCQETLVALKAPRRRGSSAKG